MRNISAGADDWNEDAANINDRDYVEVTWAVFGQDGRTNYETDFVLTAREARVALEALART